MFRNAIPNIALAFRNETMLMRIKATLFVSGAIQFSAFPQRFSTHLINALALHSAHSSACLYISYLCISLTLLIVTQPCISNLYAALPLLIASIQCRHVTSFYQCSALLCRCHAKQRFSVAYHIVAFPLPCFSWLIHFHALLRLSVAQRIPALSSQCFTRPSQCKTEQFNAFPQLRIA